MDLNPICHPSAAKNMKCSFLDYIQLPMIGQAGQWTQTPSATLSSKKMKCLFLDYLQLLMIGRAGRWNWTPSTTSLQPKKWNAHFWITFNFWWLAGLVDGLEPCVPPLCSQKNEMPIFRLHSTSDDWPGWSKDSNLICHPSPAKNMKCLFLDYIQLLMIGQAGLCTRTPFATSLQPKKWNAHFWLHSTPDDQPGWSMDSNPIYHLSPATKIKCSFLDYVQLLMISWIGQWTRMPSTTPLQPKTWNACFWITFNFWWLARLVDALKPHLPPLSSQKIEMLIFGLHSTSDDQPGWSMELNPIYHLSPAKKNEMLIFGLHSNSDDKPGWLMDSNPICHPSPAKRMKS